MLNSLKLLVLSIVGIVPSAMATESAVQGNKPTFSSSPVLPFLPELTDSQTTRPDGPPKVNLKMRVSLDQRIIVTANLVKSSLEQLLDAGATEIDYNASFTLELLVTEVEQFEFGNACLYLNEAKEMILKGTNNYQLEQSEIQSTRTLIQNINLLTTMILSKLEVLSNY